MTIRYAYDGDQIIAEYDGAGTLLRKFVYGPGIDEPICLIDAANANALYYYHCDGLGSVVALCDVNNAPVERYAYDVFGRPTIRDAGGVDDRRERLRQSLPLHRPGLETGNRGQSPIMESGNR